MQTNYFMQGFYEKNDRVPDVLLWSFAGCRISCLIATTLETLNPALLYNGTPFTMEIIYYRIVSERKPRVM